MRFLFVDRILLSTPAEYIRGVKHVTQDDFYLTRDDKGKLCFMPSLLGETLGQLAAWNVMAYHQFRLRPVAGVVAEARLLRPAYVGETVQLESFIDALDEHAVEYHSEARVGKELVFTIEGALGPLLPMTDFIDETTIQQQYHELDRPGDLIEDSEYQVAEFLTSSLLPAEPYGLYMGFDHILSCIPQKELVAEKKVSRAAPYFPDHFPKKPVLPMTILLESKINLAKQFLARSKYPESYQVQALKRIKMNDFIAPGAVVRTHLHVKQQTAEELILTYRSEVEGKRVCVVDIILGKKNA